jgi:hypothetical protein
MGAPMAVCVILSAVLVGCTSSVQVGLANAPWLGGETPETRVHDVIANGHDSCERSAFPQGGVLRGQIPPCIAKEKLATIPATRWIPPPPGMQVSPSYRLRACSRPGPGMVGGEKAVAGLSVSTAGGPVCGTRW